MLNKIVAAGYRVRLGLIAICCAVLLASAQAPAAVSLLVTADTEGHVRPCQSCPDQSGFGGLDRRATAVADLRAKDPSVLLVDAGNALMGADSVASEGKVIVTAYNALGYDAVNLTYRDFRLGKAVTLARVAEAKFPFVSANLLDAQSGQPLVKPYIVKTMGGQKVGIVGVSEVPAALEILPHLKRQLEGVRLAPPVDALASILPQARAEAGQVVLLYYGSPAGLQPILAKFGNDLTAVAVGGARPAELPADHVPPLIAAEVHGKSLAQASVEKGKGAKATQLAVAPTLKPDAKMQTALAPYTKRAPMPTAVASIPRTPAGNAPATPMQETPQGQAGQIAALTPGKTEPVSAGARNRAVSLSVSSVALLDKIGEATPSEGKRFIVMDVAFRNLQEPHKVDDQIVPMQYKVPNLADNLYAVGGHTVLTRIEPSVEGLLPFGELLLEKQDDTAAGKLVYEVPAASVPSQLALRFYDSAYGNIVVPLVGSPTPEGKPVAAKKNAVVEASVFGVQRSSPLGDQKAPPGMSFYSVDLRARSTIATEANASDYDPLARKGTKIKIETVADWKESRKYAQLVVDGQYAYMPLPQSEMPEEPRFLPDVMTGGNLVFLAPEKCESLELRCDFPNAKLPDGKVQRPAGLTLAVEGKRPSVRIPPQVASVRDGIFDVSIVGENTADEFAGVKADDGQRFLVLDVIVRNAGGKQQEFFQTKEQLKHAAQDGSIAEMDEATFQGLHRPPELIYIPQGESRRFEAAYRIANNETRPRLAYAAVTEGGGKVIALKPLARGASPANPPAVAEGTPAPQAQPSSQTPAAQPPMPERSAQNPTAQRPAVAEAIKQANAPAPNDPAVKALKPRPHGPALGLAGVGLTPEQVNAAIDKGCAGLWAYLQKEDKVGINGTLGNRQEHILCALALVHGGWHKKSPEFNSALRQFLATVHPDELGTYQAGLLCMLVQAYGDPAFEPKLQTAARWLIEAQGPEGTWTYHPRIPETVFKVVPQANAIQVSGGLPPGKRAEGWKRVTDWKVGQDGDNSCSQYAMLGLNAAFRSGVTADPELWKRALNEMLKRQDEDGGWAYHDKSNSYGSMTCSGICAVAICRSGLGEANPTQDPAIDMGLAWLDTNFKVDNHPGSTDSWVYYYLYSLERVGRILDTEFIGVNEWYPQGARWLISQQKADGTWAYKSGSEEDPRLASSFALLFLTRATESLKPAEKHGPGTLRTAAIAPDNRFYIILDASGSMIDTMDGKVKFDIARDSVRGLINALPPNCEVALRVYGHRKSSIQPGADEDTELKIPMEKLDKPKFNATLDTLRARGRTPLALSLQQTTQDLGQPSEDKPVTVLLLTDGGEDTFNPRGNPIKAAEQFGKVKNVTFHIVGFDINRPDWSEQLQKMAALSHARYWPATKAAELERTVRTAVLGLPDEYQVLDEHSHVVAKGPFGDPQKLPEGHYHFQALFAGRAFTDEFWINPDEVTSITFDASRVKPGEGTPAQNTATVAQQPEAPAAPGKATPKFCTNCGAPLKPGAKFCTNCGHKVE